MEKLEHAAFSNEKLHEHSCGFQDGFWTDFEVPDPSDWGSRLHEALIFIKPHFPLQGRFLAKLAPKMNQNDTQWACKIGTKIIDFFKQI